MEATRRQFMRIIGFSGAAVGLSTLLPIKALTGISPLEMLIETSKVPEDVVSLFIHELSTYPKGNVAHSVMKVEKIYHDELANEIPNQFDISIRGMSAGENNNFAYFAFICNENFYIEDCQFRREHVKDAVSQLQLYWQKRGVKWINADRVMAFH